MVYIALCVVYLRICCSFDGPVWVSTFLSLAITQTLFISILQQLLRFYNCSGSCYFSCFYCVDILGPRHPSRWSTYASLNFLLLCQFMSIASSLCKIPLWSVLLISIYNFGCFLVPTLVWCWWFPRKKNLLLQTRS